jgi:hypothetical protein
MPSAPPPEHATDVPRPAPHWRALATAAAAALVVVGLVAIVRWRDGERTLEPAAASPTTQLNPTQALPDHGADFVGASAPPLLAMSAAGWTLSSIDDNTQRRSLFVAVDSATGFGGSAFIVGPSPLPTADGSRPGVPGSESLASLGIDGTIIGTEGERTIEWRVDNQVLSARALNLRDDDALAIVKSLSITPDGAVGVTDLPAHLVALAPAEFATLGRYVTYTWANDDDSQTIEATLGGAENIGPSLANQALLEPTAFGTRTAYYSGDIAMMRVTWLDGFWHWTLSGTGFTDKNDFLDDALTVTSTDRASWEKQVSGRAVTPSQRPAAVAEILADIPTPAGFDPDSIASEDVAQSRSPLIARVTSAVWCGWAEQWDSAMSAGNDELAAAASTAIASSKDWDALLDIADQSGWSDVMWGASAQVVAGDRAAWANSRTTFNCSS